jgi:hypothetical protein
VFIVEEGRPRLLGQSTEVRSWTKRPERDVSFPTLVLETGKPYVVRIFARDDNGEQLVDETAPFWLNDQPGRINVPFAHGGSLLLPIVGAGLAETTKRSKDRFVLKEATVAGRPSDAPGKSLLFKVVAYEGAGVTRAVTVGQSEPVAGWSSGTDIRVRFPSLVLRTRLFYVIQSFLRDVDGERLTDETPPFELTSDPGTVMVGFARGGSILLSIEGAGLVGAAARSHQLLSMPIQP